jgi:hypothetical protein
MDPSKAVGREKVLKQSDQRYIGLNTQLQKLVALINNLFYINNGLVINAFPGHTKKSKLSLQKFSH